MNKSFFNTFRASALIISTAFLCCVTAGRTYAADCVPARASGPVSAVYKASEKESVFASVPRQNRSQGVVLGNRIVVEVQELAKFITEAKCRNKGVLVVLNGQPVKGLALFGPDSETSNLLYFDLKRTSAARPVWTEILGSPDFTPRKVAVTLGIEGEVPLPASANDTVLDLDVLPVWSALAALAGFLVLFGAFIVLTKLTNILRDGSPPEDAIAVVKGRLDPRKSIANNGTYSLARLQGAWWFFIILAAYLLIGIVTWDFFNSVSSTAVILLGIGAGTVIGAAVIDTSKNTPEQKDAQEKKAAELKARIEHSEDAEEFASLEARRLGPTPLTALETTKRAALVAR